MPALPERGPFPGLNREAHRLPRFLACLAAVAMGLLAGTAGSRAGQTTAFLGGAIYTLNDRQPWASALVVRDGRIAYVGSDDGARPFIGRNARVIRLHGRMMLPGFHDAHAHPMSGAMRLVRCNLSEAGSLQKVEAAVRACALAHRGDKWLVAYGWNSGLAPSAPELLARLDRLVPDRPAYLSTYDGFTAWVNSRALEAAGIDPRAASPQIDGLARDPATHLPTGVVSEVALERVHGAIPPPGEAQYREAFRRWSALASQLGITSVFDASATPPMVAAYHASDLAGELGMRVTAAQLVDPSRGPGQIDAMVALRDRTRGPLFRADAAKIFLDGEIGMHTAALLAPYADSPGTPGEPFVPAERLDALVRRLDAEGFLIHMHAMGDRAVRAGLDALESAAAANGALDRRPQLAHVGVADPADVPRFAALGVAANFQPLWFQSGDPAFLPAAAALGPERAEHMYPLRSIARAGGRIVASSDWPGTSLDPLDAIEVALTHRPPGGTGPAVLEDQRTDLETILAAYTRNAAWAVREDAIDGTLETGKAADLVVLDRNLFRIDAADIHTARVVLTLLNGRPAYRDKTFGWR
jgi:predicted amidohydrolase YtcJ